MTTMPRPSALGSGYAAKYDAWNRLVEVKASTTVVQANEYDGLHRRIIRDETGGSGDKRHFYYNFRWQVLEERVEVSGTIDPDPLMRNLWHPYYIDAPAAREYDDDLNGTGTMQYFTHDANFNVTAIYSISGGLFGARERYAYTPYGEVTFLNPNFTHKTVQATAYANEHLYTGRTRDPVTGLYDFRTRFYHAPLGRFTSQDWIDYGGGMNLYAYVGGMPTGFVDPWGLVEYGHPAFIPRPPSCMDCHATSIVWGGYPDPTDQQLFNACRFGCNEPGDMLIAVHITLAATGLIAVGSVAVAYTGTAVAAEFVVEELTEAAFEYFTGVPLVLGPGDLLESGLKRGGKETIQELLDDAVEPSDLKKLLPDELNVGTYDELIDAGRKGDNITPHHVPSAEHMKEYGVDKGDGLAINMEHLFPGRGGRHRRTFTYGTKADSALSARDALAEGIKDLRKIYNEDGLYGANTRKKLLELIDKNKEKFSDLFKKNPCPP